MRSVLLALLFGLLSNVSDSVAQCAGDRCPVEPPPPEVFKPVDFARIKITGDRFCNYGDPQQPIRSRAGLETSAYVVYEDWTPRRLARRYDCECHTVLTHCTYQSETVTSCPAGMTDDQPDFCSYQLIHTEVIPIVAGERFGPSFDPYLDTNEFAQEACDEFCASYGGSFREQAAATYCQDPPLPELHKDVEIRCSGPLRALNVTPNVIVTDITFPARPEFFYLPRNVPPPITPPPAVPR